MKRKYLIILLVFITLPLFASDLSDYKTAEQYISQNKVDKAVKILKKLYKTSKDTSILPGVILHLADLTYDAELSSKYYKDLYKKFPKSKEATLALIRLGQYYYALEAYNMAISYFSKASKRPLSNFAKQKVQYWLGKSYIMTDKKDSAKLYFKLVMTEDTLSPYFKLAKSSLTSLTRGKTVDKKISVSTSKDTSVKYGIQIGAFSSKSNANQLKEKYAGKGYDVFIIPATTNKRASYRVIIGKFSNRNDAEDYIKIFRKAEGISCWITKISI